MSASPFACGLSPQWATSWGEDTCGVYAAFGVGEVEHRMRWIAPGRFVMGAPMQERWRLQDEGPQHEVVLSHGFWLGETPVTQALWIAVMGKNPSFFKGATHPVERVSWEDCALFLAVLNEMVGGGYRLPTEAEWEYACRAGTTTSTWVGYSRNETKSQAPLLDGIAWYADNSGSTTHPVGEKAANPWGLYDMLGNVWEWCADRWGAYDAAPVVDPTGPTTETHRVRRGGSWDTNAKGLYAASRSAYHPGSRYDFLGFRLVREHSDFT